jgi:hypothetical protein
MLDPPPAIVMVSPDVPAGFTVDRIERIEAVESIGRSFRILPAGQACLPSRPDEIVVCGRGNSRYRFGTPLPEPDILMTSLSEKLDFHLGRIETGSLKAGDERQLGIRIRF